jgi:voltage-gated potassium channel
MGAEPAPDQDQADATGDPFVGPARSPEAARRLAEHDKRIYLPLLLSALLPIVVAASRAATDSRVSIVVNVVAWLVFVYDLFVHMRYVRRYLRTKVGIFDLSVVILTAPWFLIPGFGGSQILMLARLARLVRLFFVSRTARQLGRRLGSVGLFAAAMLLFCSWMAYVAEHPTNSGFATYGDALWWGIVTLTTVGYGDIVPHTQKGRVAGVFLMLTGVATLGVISGTLASAFRSLSRAQEAAESEETAAGGVPPDVSARLADLQAQLATLEGQLTTLVERSNPAASG